MTDGGVRDLLSRPLSVGTDPWYGEVIMAPSYSWKTQDDGWWVRDLLQQLTLTPSVETDPSKSGLRPSSAVACSPRLAKRSGAGGVRSRMTVGELRGSIVLLSNV